jgi:hypothetical protein
MLEALLSLLLFLTLLLALTIGAVDFARYAVAYIAVTNGARAGAGVGGMHSYTSDTYATWEQRLRDAVEDEVEGIPGFDPAQLEVTTPQITHDPGELRRLRLEVRYPFETVAPWPLIPSTMLLTRTVEMPFIR